MSLGLSDITKTDTTGSGSDTTPGKTFIASFSDIQSMQCQFRASAARGPSAARRAAQEVLVACNSETALLWHATA